MKSEDVEQGVPPTINTTTTTIVLEPPNISPNVVVQPTNISPNVVVEPTNTCTTVVDPSKLYPSLEKPTIKEKLEVAKESKDGVEYFIAAIFIIVGTIGCSIITFILSFIPIAMICVGIIHLKDCPACDFIPIYLLIGGFMGLLNQTLNWFKCRSKVNEDTTSIISSKFTHAFDMFVIVWFMIGSYWVYKTDEPNYIDPTNDNYCHKGTFLFAFWLITSAYIIMGILFVSCCCMCSGLICLSKSDNE